MSTLPLRIPTVQEDKDAWKSSIAIAASFYLILIGLGFSTKADALLDLIAEGETIAIAASDPVVLEQREIEVDLAPPPPPEANPEFIKPEVKIQPKVAEAPKPKPRPVVAQTETPKPSAPPFAASGVIVGNKNFPKPPYPMEAKLKKFQGTVILSISVAGGSIQNVSVSSSSGYGILDSTARSWVQSRWKFPEGITRDLQLPIRFELSI